MKSKGSDFFDQVYQVVKLIPSGRVCSYGAIANYLGKKGSARMVGYAMNAAHSLPDVPAHRVVNRIGMLSGKNHFGGPIEMQLLLEKEGIKINKDQIVDFDIKFWNPEIELAL